MRSAASAADRSSLAGASTSRTHILDAERFAKVDPILDENAEQLDRELAALEFTDSGMTAVRIPGRSK